MTRADLRSASRLSAVVLVAAVVAAAPALCAPQSNERLPVGQPSENQAGQVAVPPQPAGYREPGRPGSLQLTLGGEWLLSQGLGSRPANLVANNPSTSPYTLFNARGTRRAAPAFRGGIAYSITSTLAVEGSVLASRGDVQVRTSGDQEDSTAATTVTGRLTQYFVDVSLLAHLPFAFAQGDGVPFLEAGGGYLRQMHEGNFAANTGQVYHVGGGVSYLISRRPTGLLSGLAFRGDARVYLPRRGFKFDTAAHPFLAVGGRLVLAF